MNQEKRKEIDDLNRKWEGAVKDAYENGKKNMEQKEKEIRGLKDRYNGIKMLVILKKNIFFFYS
jgi:uncharacterized protein YukE